MRIAQIVLPDASEYERKCQRADHAALAELHQIVEDVGIAEVAHVYAGVELPRAAFVGFPVPYVASAPMAKSRWSWRKAVEPRTVVTPDNLPEVVEDAYFSWQSTIGSRQERKIVGSF